MRRSSADIWGGGRIILLDDYNSNLHGDGIIGTVTPQFGNSAPRNGWKIIEESEL